MQSFFQILCDTKLVLEQHVAAVSSQSTHPNLIKLDMNIVDAICEDVIQGICIISTGSGSYCPHMQSCFQILCDTKLVLEQHVAAVSSQSTHPKLIKLDMNIIDAVCEDGIQGICTVSTCKV